MGKTFFLFLILWPILLLHAVEIPIVEGETLAEQCTDLEEKIDLVRPIQQSISEAFATVKDKELCKSMTAQCEYFYRVSKTYQKIYQGQCNPDYAIELSHCSYQENPCPRLRKLPYQNALHAQLEEEDH